MPRTKDVLPARPFIDWLKERQERHLNVDLNAPGEMGVPTKESFARSLGVSERFVKRYLREHTGAYVERRAVEDVLAHVGVGIWELYPELADEHSDIRDRYCSSCRDRVTTGPDELCPWCERPTEPREGRVRHYCPRCDRSVIPAHDRTCWRCGTLTDAAMPWDECGCGCGQTFARFDEHGRRRRWVRGHAPKAYLNEELEVGPFADYLERALRDLDPIDALARIHKLPRELILYALERRGPVDRVTVNGALRAAGMQGKGMPWKDGVPTLSDLYPDRVRSTTCPDCGGGKAPHADRCKRCSVAHRRQAKQPRQRAVRHRLRDDLLDEAWSLHLNDGLSIGAVAKRLLPRTPYRSADSLRQALARQLQARGQQPQRGIPVSDELLEVAHRLPERGGMTIADVAAYLHGRTAHPTEAALRAALYRRMREKGYRVRRGRPAGLPDRLVLEAHRLNHQERLHVKQVADRLEVGERLLRSELRRRGLKLRGGAPAADQLPDELVREAHRLNQQEGVSVAAAARRLQVSERALRRDLRRLGLHPRPRNQTLDDEVVRAAHQLRVAEQLSIPQAAERLGVDARKLRRGLARLGLRAPEREPVRQLPADDRRAA